MNLGSMNEDLEANKQTEPHQIIEVPDYPIDLPESVKEAEDTTVTCSICYLDLPVTSVIHPLACEHSFCRDCYTEYLENKMKSFEVLKITCPQDGCPEIVTDERIKTILTEDRFQRYQELVQKKLSHKSWGQKYCPHPGCFKPFTPDQESQLTVCTCGTEICNTCSQVWHPGKPCIEIKDEEFAEYAKANNIKFCIVCKTAIDRVEGCLHVTCSVCDYEWCWSCGKQYSPKHACNGVWDPSVPVMQNEKPPGKFMACLITVLKILIAPFAILGIILFVLLFWPLIIAKDNGRYRNQPRNRKIKMAVCSFLVGVICLPIVLVCLVFYILIIMLAAIFLCFSDPGYRKAIARRRRQNRLRRERIRARQNPRWKMKDGNNFQYTAVSKPQDQVEQVDENNDNILNMRGPRIDAGQIQPIDVPNFVIERRHSLNNLQRRDEQIQGAAERVHQSLILDTSHPLMKRNNSFGRGREVEKKVSSLVELEKSKTIVIEDQKNISLPFKSEEGEEEESVLNFEKVLAVEDKKDGTEKSIKIREESPKLIKINSIDSRKIDVDSLKQIQTKEELEIKIVE